MNAKQEIGEMIVILVNILGWFVLAITLVVGTWNVVEYLVPTSEVTIEQAE